MKSFVSMFVLMSLTSNLFAQSFDRCKVEKNKEVPGYRIGKWERSTPQNLLVFIGLRSKNVDEKGLRELAGRLEKEFCKENRVTFWIFDDLVWAIRGPFTDTGSFWEEGKKSSIAGYSFDRISGENSMEFRLDGNHGVTGFENKKLTFGKPSPKTP